MLQRERGLNRNTTCIWYVGSVGAQALFLPIRPRIKKKRKKKKETAWRASCFQQRTAVAADFLACGWQRPMDWFVLWCGHFQRQQSIYYTTDTQLPRGRLTKIYIYIYICMNTTSYVIRSFPLCGAKFLHPAQMIELDRHPRRPPKQKITYRSGVCAWPRERLSCEMRNLVESHQNFASRVKHFDCACATYTGVGWAMTPWRILLWVAHYPGWQQ